MNKQQIVHVRNIGDKIKEFFKVETHEDVDFLCDVQDLHDFNINWKKDGLHLEPNCILQFCNKWKLQPPKELKPENGIKIKLAYDHLGD